MAGVRQTRAAFRHITGVSITLVTDSQNWPDGSGIFFPRHGHRLAHPPVDAKGNKAPKNGYGGKFPLQGESL